MLQDTLGQGACDPIDTIVEQWQAERPDLDVSAKHVSGRIVRLGSLLVQAYSDALAPLGLDVSAFGVLAALRRAGGAFELTPKELCAQRLMTSGGMTALLDRLERRGLVARAPNPNDRRGSLVRLTEEGRALVDRAVEVHAQVEQRQLAALDRAQRDQLGALLRKLLVDLEGSDGGHAGAAG